MRQPSVFNREFKHSNFWQNMFYLTQLANLINLHFGRRSGFFRTALACLKDFFGAYSEFRDTDLAHAKRFIFVCNGNTCRSAYAEAKAQSLGLNAISCGLQADNNAFANELAIQTALRRHIDLSCHRTKNIRNIKIEQGDVLLAFEPCQANDILKLTEDPKPKVSLVGLYLDFPLPLIQDPYGLSDAYFDKCFDRIDDVLKNIKDKTVN